MAGFRGFVLGLAVLAAIAVPAWFLTGALGTKFGLLDWTVGFGLMTVGLGSLVLLGALGIALLALGLSLLVKPRKGALLALACAVIPAAGLGYGVYVQGQTKAIPPIHDISTNRIDPPQFSEAVLAARAKVTKGNDLDYANNVVPNDPRWGAFAGKTAADLTAQAYPGVKPIAVEIDADDALIAARDVAEALGWKVTRFDQAAGALEAESTSFWYGFTDDIAVRVRPGVTDVGATVDVRSVSRVGLSDLGANAARIQAFSARFEQTVAGAATGN